MESKLSRQEETHNKHSSKHDEDDICAAAESKQISHLAESKDIVMSKFNSPVSRRRSESADAKLLEIEQEEALAADAEFEALKNVPTEVVPEVANTQEAKNFVNGFRIISMNMKDAATGEELWRSADWDPVTMFDMEIDEKVPKAILTCRAVSREITFSCSEEISKFRLEQRVYYRGTCIEEWFFTFGFVIPGSQNTWQQTIDAAPASEMLPAEVLSGNVVFETSFYDDTTFLCKNSVRIFYV